MRNKSATKDYYLHLLQFSEIADYGNYLIVKKDDVEIHFFEYKDLNPEQNYGMVYIRVEEIEKLYQDFLDRNLAIHPNGKLAAKPWNQKEFSLLDPDFNLLTFGERV